MYGLCLKWATAVAYVGRGAARQVCGPHPLGLQRDGAGRGGADLTFGIRSLGKHEQVTECEYDMKRELQSRKCCTHKLHI